MESTMKIQPKITSGKLEFYNGTKSVNLTALPVELDQRVNGRSVETVKELKNALVFDGVVRVHSPLVVMPKGYLAKDNELSRLINFDDLSVFADDYIVVSGNTRLTALKELAIDQSLTFEPINVQVLDKEYLSDYEVFSWYQSSINRAEDVDLTSKVRNTNEYFSYLVSQGIDKPTAYARAAKAFGLSQSRVRSYAKYDSFPENLQKLVDSGRLSFDLASEISSSLSTDNRGVKDQDKKDRFIATICEQLNVLPEARDQLDRVFTQRLTAWYSSKVSDETLPITRKVLVLFANKECLVDWDSKRPTADIGKPMPGDTADTNELNETSEPSNASETENDDSVDLVAELNAIIRDDEFYAYLDGLAKAFKVGRFEDTQTGLAFVTDKGEPKSAKVTSLSKTLIKSVVAIRQQLTLEAAKKLEAKAKAEAKAAKEAAKAEQDAAKAEEPVTAK